MLIDWFTVGAQVLNFLVLIGLMKHFLYQPILSAIDAREKRIADALADVDAKAKQARKARADFEDKKAQLEAQREELIQQMTAEIEARRKVLMKNAQDAADVLLQKRQESFQREAKQLDQRLRLHIEQEVFAIARQVLRDVAGVSLDQLASEMFIRRMQQLDDLTRERLAEILSTGEVPLLRSAFGFTEEQRAALRNALVEILSCDMEIEYQTAPELIAGIELRLDGQQLVWSIADYLAELEANVHELVQQGPSADSAADAASRSLIPADHSA